MQFALLIWGSNDAYESLSADETAEMYAAHERFGARLAADGAAVGGAELAYSPNRVVRRDGDRHVVTDGPFAEAAEGIGGWYLVEADDVDAATEYAKKLPILPTDHVEVRRIMTEADR